MQIGVFNRGIIYKTGMRIYSSFIYGSTISLSIDSSKPNKYIFKSFKAGFKTLKFVWIQLSLSMVKLVLRFLAYSSLKDNLTASSCRSFKADSEKYKFHRIKLNWSLLKYN